MNEIVVHTLELLQKLYLLKVLEQIDPEGNMLTMKENKFTL